jgi:peptide chain release factor subunit 1
MLTQEYGTASNIKSRVNRLSVLAAITSTQQRLKLYNRVPPNGLVLFVGTILTDEGKEKKVSFDFEPHKPINTCVFFLRELPDVALKRPAQVAVSLR